MGRKSHFWRELKSWATLAFALGVLEGGVAGVLVRHRFDGLVSDDQLAFFVALVVGAPTIANLASPLWAYLEQGRDKIKFVSYLGMLLSLTVGIMAIAPRTSLGLVMFSVAVLLGRFFWTGILTVRATIWRANYPRNIRAKLTGKMAIVMAVIMATSGASLGVINDTCANLVPFYLGASAVLGALGAWAYRAVRLRGADQLYRAERRQQHEGGGFRLAIMWEILRTDKLFRNYMMVMFVFGSGNLMFMAPMILVMNDTMHIDSRMQMLATSSIPLALMPFLIQWWARRLDRMHIIEYRAFHCWSFVIAIGCFAATAISGWQPLLWLAAFLYGIAVSGAVLGWNLGHLDFASQEKAAQYMTIHITLTGIRGLLMPMVGVALYQWLNRGGVNGAYALLLPFSLNVVGALAFQWLKKNFKKQR
jgi:hypothetical protein